MQGYDKIMQKAIGQVIYKERKRRNLKFTIFCYENDISKTTLYMIEQGKNRTYSTNLFRIVQALGLSFEEFGRLLKEELPEDYRPYMRLANSRNSFVTRRYMVFFRTRFFILFLT